MMALLLSASALALCPNTRVTGTSAHRGAVPANADLWVFYDRMPLDLPFFQGNDTVQAELIDEGHGLARVELEEPLVEGATYTLFGDTFVVEAADSDTEPPVAPVIEQIERHYHRSKDYSVESMTVHSQLSGDAAWLDLEVGLDRDFAVVERFGAPEDDVRVGDFSCSANWKDYQRGRDYTLRLRQVDAAGNLSEWSDTTRTCGCTATRRPRAWAWASLLRR